MRPRASKGFLALLWVFTALGAQAGVDRVVILKADGLPERLVERYAGKPAAGNHEGRSLLPWIQHVFEENGSWLENFYVRGISLSAPSWSLLDTGRPLEIRANAEYDRYTLRVHDYLNFFPFYLGYARSSRVDMPGVELLDEQGIPLLLDHFPYAQRFQGFQLLQRGVRWTTLENSLKRGLLKRRPKELFDEWQTGFDLSDSLTDQTEHELITKLQDPSVRYLDFFTGEFDHVAHLTPDSIDQLHAIQAIDGLVGRVWSAIQQSPLADTTALVLVSDHGFNTSNGVYSQGFNLVDWFNSAAGGGHHVLTDRHPMTEFKLKGLDPFVSEVITPSHESAYLDGQTDYPTVMLELDGNEKAGIGLRNNTFNILQILLEQLMQKHVTGSLRVAALNGFFEALDRVRGPWQRDLDDLSQELDALQARIAEQQKLVDAQPKKWAIEQRQQGLDKEARRQAHLLESWKDEKSEYEHYAAIVGRLLSLTPADFDPGKFKMEDLIPPLSLGPPNSIYDLQNYVTGPAAGGLVEGPDRSLDFKRSFRTIDYFAALGALRVRNVVQKEVGPKPVDFIAVALPDDDGIWLWGGEDRQALILRRRAADGTRELGYVPIAHLRQDRSGELCFDRAQWASGFPLELYEDPQLAVPAAERREWLSQWHSEREWFEAVHRTRYSNGIIGLTEELLEDARPPMATPLDRYKERKRRLRRTDLLVFARDHWNFNVRGFNPGGNHGSLLRVSTHSVFLIAGGKRTGIPRGLRVETPYDSLSFVPTILALMGRPEPNLPGPVIKEILVPGP